MYELNNYDYVVFCLALLLSIFIGLYHALKAKCGDLLKKYLNRSKSRKSRKTDLEENDDQIREYLMASGSMSSLPIAFSLLASFFSATSLLGYPAEVYQYGIQYWISIFSMMITPIIGALATGPFFARLKVVSVFEYLDLRYELKLVRLISVLCYLLKNLIYIAICLYGPATTINALTKINSSLAVIIIGSVSTFYTTIGGIKGVIWTDVFQMIMMFVGLFTIIGIGTHDIGGLSEILKINSNGGRLNFFDFDPNPFIRQSFWSLSIGLAFHFSMSYCLDQQMVQRFSAAKNIRTAQFALLLNVPGMFVLVSLCCFTGLVLYAAYSKCDPLSYSSVTGVKNPNQLVTYFVTDKLKMIKGMVGLFLASILSAALSSVSSCLNSLSAILLQDFLRKLRMFKELNDSKTTLTAKILVIICGVLCTGLALLVSRLGGNLVQISSTLNGSFNAPLIGVFMLACLFPFSNSIGAICGILSGFSVALWLSLGSYIKQPLYEKLEVGTECYLFNNNTNYEAILNNTFKMNYTSKNTKEALNLDGFDRFYSISYVWFGPISVFVTVIIGIIVSLITGCNEKKVESKLVLFQRLERFQKVYNFNNKIEMKHF